MIITGLIKYIVAVVGNTAKGMINIDYKVVVKALIEIYSKVIAKRDTTSIRSQIVS